MVPNSNDQKENIILPSNVLLKFYTTGKDAGGLITHHYHRYNLVIATGGNYPMLIDNKVIPLMSGHTILIHPWQIARFLVESDSYLQWLLVEFDWPQRITSLCKNELKTMNNYFNSMANLIWNQFQKVGRGLWLRLLTLALLKELPSLPEQSNIAIPLLTEDHSLLTRVQSYVLQNINRPLSIEQIACGVHCSNSRLRAIFHAHTGMPLGAYVRTIRINKAAQMLVDKAQSVTNVASECGFSSCAVFSRGFHKSMGVSPLKYRASL